MNNGIINKIVGFAKDHSPELLISAGVMGMISSTVLAVKATPKALDLMEEKKADLGTTYLTKKEMVETTWKQYAPAVGIGAVSTACIVMGTTKNLKRNTALATVYAISESTLKEYQKKTVEIAGEEKAKLIDQEVAKSRAKMRPELVVVQNDSEYVLSTGDGDTLIYDSLSGRYFRSSMNAIDRAVNSVNKTLMNDYIMTVNDFYNEINIPTVGAGSLIGWKSDKEMLAIRYDSDVDKNGNPYLVLSYTNRPQPLYNYYGSY